MVLTDDELAQITALIGDDAVASGADVHWLLYCGVLVFLMQAGFAMLCAGSIRAKNAQNILLKNLMDACVGATWFWATGYAFAYGSDSSGGNWFIGGNKYFFLANGYEGDSGFHDWFFHAVLTGFVYPVVVHWIWSGDGFLTAFVPEGKTAWLKVGVVDFAGCGVVHMVGGAAAGIGAAILGPRLGRFGPNAKPINGHSMPLVVLGTFLLWVGWYGFNPGSTLCIVGCDAVAAKVAVTTTLAAAAGGLTNLFLHYALSHVVALLLITAWVAATMTPFFLLMNALGIFRVSREFEEAGLDESKHGGSAYGIDFKEFKEVEMQIKTELEA
ncbi:ammonium transmembrane transporter [Aureococcus anophagefferens]|nr:ammonium transmembrane transporter [Aureococcus anophagefferens]